MSQLLVPVYVGSSTPASWDDIEARQREFGDDAAPWFRDQRRPPIAEALVPWDDLGLEPRWVGFDTADCAAALHPSIFAGQGADEFDRFLQGAESRGETALVVCPIGRITDESTTSVFGPSDSVYLNGSNTRINGRPLGRGAKVQLAEGLCDADSHLALRLLSCRPAPTWWALEVDGVTNIRHDGTSSFPPEGHLEPILVTVLGEPVVAAWVSPNCVERRYVVPHETPWPALLSWLVEQGLPEFVPGAMRRARRQLASDARLMTRRERHTGAALTELEAEFTARRAELQREHEELQAAASGVREGLLYGTSRALVDAVRAVLEWAEVTVVDLDDELGGTKNADLLCSHKGRARLVEVKAASGAAPERAYQDLIRHLREWEQLPKSTPVDGGVLVINHQHRLAPDERKQKPFERPEFLAAQSEPVVSSLAVFDAWREEDREAIRRLFFKDANPNPHIDRAT